jgi:hypothetical protein
MRVLSDASRYVLWVGLLVMLALVACAPEATRQPTPTRQLSAPTIAPSPTFGIRTSDELYGDTITDGQSNPTVAALPVDAGLPPLSAGTLAPDGGEMVQVVLENGTQLQGELYPTILRRPGILLLASTMDNWGVFARALQAADFTVLALEFPSPSASDMPALFAALSELGTVDPANLAVIASDNSADVALMGCAIDPICDALVMLSPQSRDTALNLMIDYAPRPLLAITAQDDTVSLPVALALANSANVQILQTATGRGTGLLLDEVIRDGILTFLQTTFLP